MLAIPLDLILLGLTIWGFFNTGLAGWVFLATVLAFIGWLVLMSQFLKSKWVQGLEANAFSEVEETIFRKYTFYFLLPFQAKQYSSVCSFVQFMCYVWFGLSLWHSQWALLAALVALFLVTSNMAMRMNIGNFLRFNHRQGKLTPELAVQLETVEAIESKILKARGLS